jgi:internalin A
MQNVAKLSGMIAASLTALLAACDSPKPAASGAPSASAPAAVAPKVDEPAVSAAPSASPPARASKRKDPASCPKNDPVAFEDATLETVVRRQLQKPSGPIARAELKKVKTLDLSQATSNDALDPCLHAPHR